MESIIKNYFKAHYAYIRVGTGMNQTIDLNLIYSQLQDQLNCTKEEFIEHIDQYDFINHLSSSASIGGVPLNDIDQTLLGIRPGQNQRVIYSNNFAAFISWRDN